VQFRDRDSRNNYIANRLAHPRGLGQPAPELRKALTKSVDKVISDFMAGVSAEEAQQAAELTKQDVTDWIRRPGGPNWLTVDTVLANPHSRISCARWLAQSRQVA
jgi:hypothetical protein